MADVLTGGCLCGGVRYEVDGPLKFIVFCHCSRCRRHSGAAVLPDSAVLRDEFRLLQGEELLRVYRTDGLQDHVFCSRCGSSLFGGLWSDPADPNVSINLGSLDPGVDPGADLRWHIFVDSKAAWHEITDDLPQFPEGTHA